MDGSLSRIAAARVLDAVLHHGRSLRAELAATLPGIEDVRDRALVEAICHAALRQHPRYRVALAAWMPKALPRGDHPLRALLYAGFAQLDPLGLPSHAAVSATVGAARAMGRAHQAGLVNALLRRALRDGLPPPDPAAAWPDWLLRRLDADWPGERDAILAASAQAAPMWLRVNARATTRAAYLQRLRGDGIAAEADPHLADALRLDTPLPVAALPGFAEGQVSVQDGAAQSVADAMAPPEVTPARPRRVLDACAAPGGKAAHLLEREPSIHLTALDLDEARLRRVRETFGRLHIGQDARLVAADAADPAAWWDGVGFDAILLDAPCSATGIVRRQPDVLLHRRESDLPALVALQARLLDALWTTLAPGGVLLYATCSILHEENARQVETFLARTADARAEPLPGHLGRVAGPGRQRLPGEGGMDGFFQARLRKAGP